MRGRYMPRRIAMRRIMVVGSGGAGKTHVARAVSARLGIPLVHLDAVYFDADWNAMPPAAFAAAQERLCAAESWVIDGNHASTLPIRLARADTVVIVDVPTATALWGAVSRQVRHGPGQHGEGVYNRLNWTVLRYVATYRRRMRPRVLAAIDACAGPETEVVRLRGRRAARRWTAALPLPRPL
jgi:adenylate kinase family enzyme